MFDTASEFDIEALRSRLGQMDDQALLRFGKSAAYMASPDAYWNEPPRDVFLLQLEEARIEWRRRLQRRRWAYVVAGNFDPLGVHRGIGSVRVARDPLGSTPLSGKPTYPANFCPICCGATVSQLRAGTTHFAQ